MPDFQQAVDTSQTNDIGASKREIERLNERVEKIYLLVTGNGDPSKGLATQVILIKRDIGDIQTDIAEIRASVDSVHSEINSLRTELTDDKKKSSERWETRALPIIQNLILIGVSMLVYAVASQYFK